MTLMFVHNPKKTNAVLWAMQVLLALIFLFAGGTKLAMPLELMKLPVSLPGPFLRFIGGCEVLGALGMIFPGWLGIKPALTPLAAAGLAIIMIGATTVTIMGGQFVPALFPASVGLLAAAVGYGRWRIAPFAPAAVIVQRALGSP